MKSYKKYSWVLLALLISFIGGYYSRPKQTTVKIKTVMKERIVKNVKKDVEIIEKNDGTKITRIKFRKSITKQVVAKRHEQITTKVGKRPKYSLGIGGLTSLSHVQGSMRVFSNVHIGGYVSENSGDYQYGLLLRIEF